MDDEQRRGWGGTAATNVVIIAVIALVVLGAAVPTIRRNMAASDRAVAFGDLRAIAADVSNYERDTGRWPGGKSFGFTDGAPALGEGSCAGDVSSAVHVSRGLVMNEPAVPGWDGPYMSVSHPDPWGHRYVAVFPPRGRAGAGHGWVLSAGPDGVFDTSGSDDALRGDDLGLKLK